MIDTIQSILEDYGNYASGIDPKNPDFNQIARDLRVIAFRHGVVLNEVVVAPKLGLDVEFGKPGGKFYLRAGGSVRNNLTNFHRRIEVYGRVRVKEYLTLNSGDTIPEIRGHNTY